MGSASRSAGSVVVVAIVAAGVPKELVRDTTRVGDSDEHEYDDDDGNVVVAKMG